MESDRNAMKMPLNVQENTWKVEEDGLPGYPHLFVILHILVCDDLVSNLQRTDDILMGILAIPPNSIHLEKLFMGPLFSIERSCAIYPAATIIFWPVYHIWPSNGRWPWLSFVSADFLPSYQPTCLARSLTTGASVKASVADLFPCCRKYWSIANEVPELEAIKPVPKLDGNGLDSRNI